MSKCIFESDVTAHRVAEHGDGIVAEFSAKVVKIIGQLVDCVARMGGILRQTAPPIVMEDELVFVQEHLKVFCKITVIVSRSTVTGIDP